MVRKLGWEDAFLVIPSVGSGYFLLVLGMILNKFLSHLLMELSAVAIAQRQLVEGVDGLITPLNMESSQHSSYTEIEESLSPSQLVLFSPAARYVGVSGVNSGVMYAGFPRAVWRAAIAIGMMHPLN